MTNNKSKRYMFILALGAFLVGGFSLFSTALGCWSCPQDGTYTCPNNYPSYLNCFPTKCSLEECTWSTCADPPPLPKYKCQNSGGTAAKCTELRLSCIDWSSTINTYECTFQCHCNIFDPVEWYCTSGGSWTFSCNLE